MAAVDVLPPTLEGVTVTTHGDAGLILNAVLDGVLFEYPQRLSDDGRDAVRPGHVYVVRKGGASGIYRWTDGLTQKKSGGSTRSGQGDQAITRYTIDDQKVCERATPRQAWVRKVFNIERVIAGQKTAWKIVAYDFAGSEPSGFRTVETALSALSPFLPPSQPPAPLFSLPAPPPWSPPTNMLAYLTPLQPQDPRRCPAAPPPLAAATWSPPGRHAARGSSARVEAPRVDAQAAWTFIHPPSPPALSPITNFARPVFPQHPAASTSAAAPTLAWHIENALTAQLLPLLPFSSAQSQPMRPEALQLRPASRRRPEDDWVLARFR